MTEQTSAIIAGLEAMLEASKKMLLPRGSPRPIAVLEAAIARLKEGGAEQPAVPLLGDDLIRIRDWFETAKEERPDSLNWHDCVLAVKIYNKLGLPVPDELKSVAAHGITEKGQP